MLALWWLAEARRFKQTRVLSVMLGEEEEEGEEERERMLAVACSPFMVCFVLKFPAGLVLGTVVIKDRIIRTEYVRLCDFSLSSSGVGIARSKPKMEPYFICSEMYT
ncbi:hypothetical protein J3459_003859 [Metarhizium acridum]|uniref:uncharacterized protein n=1 Tax=Metarhizium acridum TaxID=92637 RepID=UPI001C6B9775|nr:hypothetical protein J3458_002797 [Metarhizium acridum]KAG8428494.1 hypothetical protein J3459_003859 [Metarhizium acridum]